MYVRYKGGGEYVCNHLRTREGQPTCQHIGANRIDAAVADAFLTALAPAELDALSHSRRVQQQMNNALRSSAERELERKRYTAALPNGSSTELIQTIGWSPRNSSADGNRR
ncbi:putative hemolysin [Bradyrhizobium ottawaense]|uniref:hypothetical protein n=1 Tax=Bradyrhizobium ottawaense TaxID=931866 RepID=UPI003833B0FB